MWPSPAGTSPSAAAPQQLGIGPATADPTAAGTHRAPGHTGPTNQLPTLPGSRLFPRLFLSLARVVLGRKQRGSRASFQHRLHLGLPLWGGMMGYLRNMRWVTS